MGAGDQYEKKSFSVPLGISESAPWPFNDRVPPSTEECPVCGQIGALGRGHYESLDRAPKRRVCMGLVRPVVKP